MSKRKVIQIAVMPNGVDMHAALFALCNDGTMWRAALAGAVISAWEQIPSVPSKPAA